MIRNMNTNLLINYKQYLICSIVLNDTFDFFKANLLL